MIVVACVGQTRPLRSMGTRFAVITRRKPGPALKTSPAPAGLRELGGCHRPCGRGAGPGQRTGSRWPLDGPILPPSRSKPMSCDYLWRGARFAHLMAEPRLAIPRVSPLTPCRKGSEPTSRDHLNTVANLRLSPGTLQARCRRAWGEGLASLGPDCVPAVVPSPPAGLEPV